MKDFQKSMLELDVQEKAILQNKRDLVKQAVKIKSKKEGLFLSIHDNYVKIMSKVQSVADYVNGFINKISESKKDKITEDVASLDNFVNRYKNI